MYKRKLKAGGVTHLTDARYFAARDLDWLGICLDGQVNGGLDVPRAKAILEWVTGPMAVGEFGFEGADSIRAKATELGLEWVQLGPLATLDDAISLRDFQLMKQVVIEPDSTAATILSECEEWGGQVAWMVLDGYKAGVRWHDFKAKWSKKGLEELLTRFPVLLAFPMDAEVLAELDAAGMGGGIQVNGSQEEEVGVKSWDDLEAVLDWLEIAE